MIMGFTITSHNSLVNSLLLFSIIFLGFTSAKDTITSSKFITDSESETVTSSDSIFKLGFFSPENSTNRYIGIWYVNVSNIIWIANRDQPLKDSSGVFKISEKGNLVVLDGKKQVLWSSKVSTTSNSTTAQLLRSGNLVLLDDTTGNTTWESFKHPCDVAVPTMRISANRITGEKSRFISRKSTSDPSSGYFSASLERLDVPEVFIWINGTRPYWRTGPWNGRVFVGVPLMSTGYLYGWNVGYEGNETVYVTYTFADQFAFATMTFTPQGKVKVVRYQDKKEQWTLMLEISDCDVYGKCGAFGSCNGQSSPMCSCLRGYEPKVPEEWNRKNWTSGCVRKEELKCERLKNGSEAAGQEDQFLKLQKMKVPDFAERLDVQEGQCGTLCLQNCSCLAYAYDAGTGCLHWGGSLIDLQQFTNAGLDLYIRLAYSEFQLRSYRYRSKKGASDSSESESQRMTGVVQKQAKLDELPLYDFEVVAAATNNFHIANTLGKGGFGPVYKGLLPDGQEIAVKRLSKTSGQGLDEFMNEVAVISKLQHRNLVRLLGCCVEGEEKILLYEFMPNKSLDAFIFDPIQRRLLDWTKRFNIIEGIARGILYLHRDSRLRIIHRDLKASNILLDAEMIPKISDFGLARIHKGEDEINTKRVVGTYGYMSPEYAMEGLFSEKSDVYSFGVLLLEIVSGKRNTSYRNDDEALSLVGFAWNLWNDDKIRSLIDPDLSTSGSENHILRCIHIAFLCVQEVAKTRPTMTTVVLMLNSEISSLPPPKQVGFVQKQNSSSVESSSQENQCNSSNNVTITEVQGR
ncbi:G-type lectin S-receptor-like serine/threonine-protein kinase At1g11330 isoform X2 [Lotus japonicus]|uniref:G-type lectin S-receptor-like serine/threonine-protein kinase At1g11330 isoform X2 n=1 Tax=Lotus japonicus TaxID=34305 RepID=UPI00258947AC|nr:G-type lectin S-receptor-like serine/threonine-protein kinase At1g11330 isoform X2 [Lotus japonicus]